MKTKTFLLCALAVGSLFAYDDWPEAGETLTVPANTTVTVTSAADVAACAALGGIELVDKTTSIINYTASDPLVLSCPVTGEGIFKATSAGELVLNGDSRDFAGEWYLDNTPTVVSNRYGLGSTSTRKATFREGANTTKYSYRFAANGLTNDVPLYLDAVSSTYNQGFAFRSLADYKLKAKCPFVQKGAVTASSSRGCNIYGGWLTFESSIANCTSLGMGFVNGTDDSYGSGYSGGTVGVGGVKITADFSLNGSNNNFMDYTLGGTDNAWSSIYICRAKVHCAATNAFVKGKILYLGNNWGGSIYNTNVLDLNGYDQEIGRLTVKSDNQKYRAESDGETIKSEVTSAKPAVLTIKEETSATVLAVIIFSGKVAVVHDAPDTWELANLLSTSTGKLTVKRGTIRFKWSAGWGGDVQVMDGATLDLDSTRALLDDKGALTVDAGGTLNVTSTAIVYVKSLSLGGTSVESGTYTADELAALAGESCTVTGDGTVNVGTLVDPVAATWTGSAGDADPTNGGNWEGGTAPNFSDGTAALTFPDGANETEEGLSLTLPANAKLYSLAVNRTKALALDVASGSLTRGKGAWTFANPNASSTTVPATNMIRCPIRYPQFETGKITCGDRVYLELAGDVSGGVASCTEYIDGTYTSFLRLRGENGGFKSLLYIRYFNAVYAHRPESLGSKDRYTHFVKQDNGETIWLAIDTRTNATPFSVYGTYTRMCFWDSSKPITLLGAFTQQNGSNGFLFDATTSLFKGGYVHGAGTPGFGVYTGGIVTFEDVGITYSEGSQYCMTFSGYNKNAAGTFRFNVPFASMAPRTFRAVNPVRIECGATDVFCSKSGVTPVAWLFGDKESSQVVDLKGYDQRCLSIYAAAHKNDTTGLTPVKGETFKVTVTSAQPATLTMSDTESHASNLRLTGAVSLVWRGTATYTIANQVSDTTGSLIVSNGCVKFDWGAGWGGRHAKVVVASGGSLAVTGDDDLKGASTFGKRTDLSIETGASVSLATDVAASCHSLTLDGVSLKHGVYGGTGAGLDEAHTLDEFGSSAGRLTVLRDSPRPGTIVFLR